MTRAPSKLCGCGRALTKSHRCVVTRLQGELNKERSAHTATRAQLDAMEARYEPLVNENDELREKLAEVEAELKGEDFERDCLRSDRDSWQGRAVHHEHIAKSIADDFDSEKRAHAATRSELQAFKAQLGINCEKYAELKDELAETRDRLRRADDFMSAHGLMRGAREQAVLAAMASADRWALQLHVCKDTEGTWCHAAAVAELARRDAEDDQPSTEERGAGGGKQFHPPAESTGAGGVPNPAPRSCEDEDRDLEGETLP